MVGVGTGVATVPPVAGADSTGAGAGGGTVTVGAGSGGDTGGTSGSGGSGGLGGPGGAPGTGSAGSGAGSPWTCTSTYLTLNNQGGFPPGGPQPGAWYSVTCVDAVTSVQVTQTVWITGPGPAGGGSPAVDPRTLALQAENSIDLPQPTIRVDPSGTSVVGLETWFWVDPTIWHDESVTATAGLVSATAVAHPVAVRWTSGDGGDVVCQGPGTAYLTGLPAAWQSTDCGHEYLRTSAGQPTLDGDPDHGTFVVTATVEWAVSWTSTGVAGGGDLPTLLTSGATLLRVVQVESVNVIPNIPIRRQTSSIGVGR